MRLTCMAKPEHLQKQHADEDDQIAVAAEDGSIKTVSRFEFQSFKSIQPNEIEPVSLRET